jgi:hypothetical protein
LSRSIRLNGEKWILPPVAIRPAIPNPKLRTYGTKLARANSLGFFKTISSRAMVEDKKYINSPPVIVVKTTPSMFLGDIIVLNPWNL